MCLNFVLAKIFEAKLILLKSFKNAIVKLSIFSMFYMQVVTESSAKRSNEKKTQECMVNPECK